jgi:hypothetical protein
VCVQVEVASLGGPEEDKKEVDTQLQQLRKNKGTLRVVTGRPLRPGDMAIVDFKTVRLDTDEIILGSTRKGMQLDTGLGDRAIGLSGARPPLALHSPKLMPLAPLRTYAAVLPARQHP